MVLQVSSKGRALLHTEPIKTELEMFVIFGRVKFTVIFMQLFFNQVVFIMIAFQWDLYAVFYMQYEHLKLVLYKLQFP